jgi:hypothetical protein
MRGLECVVADSPGDFVGAVEFETVSVAGVSGQSSWFGSGKADIFIYQDIPEDEPAVTAINQHTVLMMASIDRVIFAKDR